MNDWVQVVEDVFYVDDINSGLKVAVLVRFDCSEYLQDLGMTICENDNLDSHKDNRIFYTQYHCFDGCIH